MASPSLDALQALSTNAQAPGGLVQGALARKRLLDELKRNLQLQGPHSISGAVPEDVSQLEGEEEESPYFGKDEQARVAGIDKTNRDVQTFNRPDVTAMNAKQLADKALLASAPAETTGKYGLAMEKTKIQGAIDEKAAQNQATKELLGIVSGGQGNGGGLAGPGGSIKPTVNANGGVSFTTTQMPALVQRAHSQLIAARDRTISALQEAEKQYPGIQDASEGVDKTEGGSALGRFMSGITGVGAPKYGGPADRANAAIERGNYTLGFPTPFAKLAQDASFGNLEQMAGQLPGVRGLATITPLFKEHQSRWGHETPVATVQRLRHMAQIMDETISEMEHGVGQPQE